MLRTIFSFLTISVLMISCSTSSKISSSYINNQYISNTVPKGQHGPSQSENENLGRLTVQKEESRLTKLMHLFTLKNANTIEIAPAATTTDGLSELQIKYAALMNIMPASLSNLSLLESIDEWFGTRYRYGGTSKNGIDCSAFTREIYKKAYGIELPRTAREQYGVAEKISSTDLKEGDLVFFNTSGGVSHVGIYLRNNKFVHSSCSKGVTISDLYETYYVSRYIGAKRVNPDALASNN